MPKAAIIVLVLALALATAGLGASYLALLAGIAAGVLCFGIAYKFFRADKLELKKNHARAPVLRDALNGQARTSDDWMPDARVQGGMAFNPKHGRIEIKGRLSDDSLDRAFG